MKRIAMFGKWVLFVVILLGIVLGWMYESEKRDLEDRFNFRVLKLEQGDSPQPWCRITVRHVHTHTIEIVARSSGHCTVGVGDVIDGDPIWNPDAMFYVKDIHGRLIQTFGAEAATSIGK
jgi:hypothetical protein